MQARMLILGAALLSAAGCSGLRIDGAMKPGDRDWAMYGGSPERAHVTRSDLVPPFEEVWTYDARGGILATPLVRDSMVIIATLHGELQIVSIADGKRIGYVKLGGPIRGTPVISGQNIIVPVQAGDATLISYGLRQGKPSWKVDAGPVDSSPLLSGERVFVSTLDGELLCFDVSSGEQRWRFAPGSARGRKPFRSSPALAAGGIIVCGNDDGIVYAVRAEDGVPVWSVRTSAPVFATPIVEGDAVIVADIDGRVASVDVATGEQRWERSLSAPVYATPSSDGVMLYVAAASGELVAMDALSGDVRWRWHAGSVINAPVLVSARHLYVGSLDKRFTVLEKGSGRVMGGWALEGRMKVPAVTWNDRLIIVYEDKTVAAFRGVQAS